MTWSKVYPILTTNISASVVQIEGNLSAIASTMSGEHAPYSNTTLKGTHLYGSVSTMFSGTLSAISTLSNPAVGALAYDTQCGVCRIYDGATWPRITATYFSRLHGYRTTSQAIGSVTWTTIILSTESYDSLAEFTSTTGAIAIVESGWYLIIGTITWPTESSNNYQKTAAIYVNDTDRKATDTKYGKEEIEMEVVDIINLTATDTVQLKAYHSYTSNVSVVGANLMITRLS
jgi:hypothetical protein